MHHFDYRLGELFAEDVPLRDIAAEVGTPFYCYSHATLVRHFQVYDQAFRGIPHVVCFAMKANSNLAVLRTLARLGAGADIVSGGELRRALDAGMPPSRIVFSGVGKTGEEIALALDTGILMFNVESEMELEAIARLARDRGKRAPVAIRINPDIDPKTHPYISTGLKKNKFGIPMDAARRAYARAKETGSLEVVGVDCHIGSQLTEVGPFIEAVRKVRAFAEELRQDGHDIRYLDLGGGLGISYKEEEEPPHPSELAPLLVHELQGFPVTLVLEPGRVIVGNAGVLVTKVLYLKSGPTKSFVIVDAAMNDLVRPSLYGSYHEVRPVREAPAEMESTDVVGPICESGDFLAQERTLAKVAPGDLLALMSAGAYGFAMSSNYNTRPRVAEVLVHGRDFHVVRRRETYDDLVRAESIPSFLRDEDELE